MDSARTKEAWFTYSEKVNFSWVVGGTLTDSCAGSTDTSWGGVSSRGPPVGGRGSAQPQTRTIPASTILRVNTFASQIEKQKCSQSCRCGQYDGFHVSANPAFRGELCLSFRVGRRLKLFNNALWNPVREGSLAGVMHKELSILSQE